MTSTDPFRPYGIDAGAHRGPALVTGATGFTGGHLARALRARGHPVRALVRPGTAAGSLADAGIEVVRGDITDARAVDAAVAGMTTVYHVAAVYRTAGHPDDHYRAVHVGGTRNILDAAARHRVDRVVHCSTVGVHGAIRDVPSDEDSPFNPGDIYQQTKLEGELVAQEAFRQGLPGVVVRPAAIYGPGDLRFLKLFRAVRSGRFRMFGSGEVTYHLVYIDDLVAGFILCGEKPEALGRTYILGGSGYITLNAFVRMVAEALDVEAPRGRLPIRPLIAAAVACEALCRPFGIEPPLHRRRVDFFVKPRAFSIERA
ncbi:MAG TPA: NAD-dependent epimerase/dehydratase family protein, partial [Longimicrobiales bacterium]|nr:NAD-dependent epimerase/dehydratase family protein [Longimicrobiales bacterium]